MLTAAAVAVLVAVAAFAVDLGMQRVVRSDMQALADVVALDAARLLDGRTAKEIEDGTGGQPALNTLVASSVARNQASLGRVNSVTATLIYVVDGPNGMQIPERNGTGGLVDVPDDKIPDAVYVEAAGEVDFAFTPGSGGAMRTALGAAASTACFRLGSYVAAIRSGDSAVLSQLNDFLGLNLSALHYEQIAAADLTLAQLAADTRIGGADQLLAGTVSLTDLVNAMMTVLGNEATDNEAAITALSSFLALATGTPTVRVGDAFDISPTDAAALRTNLSVLDILAGTLMVANGEHAIEIPNVQAGVPGLGDVDGYLYVTQGPQLACGAPGDVDSIAKTSQVRTDASVDFLNLPTISIGSGFLVSGTLQTGRATGELAIKLGNATGRLSATPEVHCGAGTMVDPHTFSVDVTSGIADYSVDADVDIGGNIRVANTLNLRVDAKVSIKLAAPTGTSAQTVSLKMPPNDTVPVGAGQDPALLQTAVPVVTIDEPIFPVSSTLNALLSTLGISLAALTADIQSAIMDGIIGPSGFVENTLRPFVTNLDNMVVNPVTALLGTRMGGADVYAVQAVCNAPALRG